MFYNGYDAEQRHTSGARIPRDRLLQDEQVAALWPPRQANECESFGYPFFSFSVLQDPLTNRELIQASMQTWPMALKFWARFSSQLRHSRGSNLPMPLATASEMNLRYPNSHVATVLSHSFSLNY